jgi:hypothetical protein
MPEYTTLYDLYLAAIRNLTGRAVRLRYRAPVYVGRDGQAYKTGGGVIDLNPGLQFKDHYFVLLHEAAHVKLDFETLPDNADLPPGSVNVTQQDRLLYQRGIAHPVILKLEDRANALYKVWDKWAEKNYNRFGHAGMTREVRKLLALTEYKDGER